MGTQLYDSQGWGGGEGGGLGSVSVMQKEDVGNDVYTLEKRTLERWKCTNWGQFGHARHPQ